MQEDSSNARRDGYEKEVCRDAELSVGDGGKYLIKKTGNDNPGDNRKGEAFRIS